jgi:hypothetical protein
LQTTIKPATGARLRDHADKFRVIPEDGKMVTWDATWARRVRDGDAVVVEDKPVKAAPAPAPVDKAPTIAEKATVTEKPKKSEDK